MMEHPEQEKHLGNNAFKQAAFSDALQVLKHPAYDQPRMHERKGLRCEIDPDVDGV